MSEGELKKRLFKLTDAISDDQDYIDDKQKAISEMLVEAKKEFPIESEMLKWIVTRKSDDNGLYRGLKWNAQKLILEWYIKWFGESK
jgi:hypothetical protein